MKWYYIEGPVQDCSNSSALAMLLQSCTKPSTCSTAVTEAEHKLEFRLTKDTPYLTLLGELWGVFCEDFGENWPRY